MVRPWFMYFIIFCIAFMPVGAILANVSTFMNIDPLEAWWNATASYHYRFSPAGVLHCRGNLLAGGHIGSRLVHV